MKKKILSIVLSFSMIFSTTGFAFADADLDSPPAEPTKPKVENYKDNDKIEQYNKEAEEYNKKASEYNAAVDKEYNDAVADTNKKNTEGQQKQADSQKAHDDAIAANEAEQKRVDEENKKIDEFNATESDRIENVNKEKTEQYNQDKIKYGSDLEQYEKDYADYNSIENQTDIKNEQKLKEKGYSISEYNMLPLKTPSESFEELTNNAVYRKGVREENASLKEKEYTSTVEVQKAENQSGETYTLFITHYLISNGQTYTETITFDANDIVTVTSLAYANNAKPLFQDKNYGAFYTYQGDKYLSYYWYQTFGTFENPPLKEESDLQSLSDKGNKYVFTYQNGKKYSSDSNEVYITYYYNSYITCNIPLSEPIAPIAPVLNLETFNPVAHINPNFINVPDVETWKNLPEPVKRKYLKYLSNMNLFAVPMQKDGIQIGTILPQTNSSSAPIYAIKMNTIKASTKANNTSDIKSLKIPLNNFDKQESWALINLLAALLTIIIGLVLLIIYIIDKLKEDDSEDKEYKNKLFRRVVSFIIGIIALIIFFLTEDITLPMVLVDQWTILMIIILIINIILAILSRRKEKEKEEN